MKTLNRKIGLPPGGIELPIDEGLSMDVMAGHTKSGEVRHFLMICQGESEIFIPVKSQKNAQDFYDAMAKLLNTCGDWR